MTKTTIQKKICLLGEFAVGKTSLVERFVYNRFSDDYLSTIGVKISRKIINLDIDRDVNLLVWDLAGGENYTGVQASYVQGAAGALLVCDLTRANTLSSLRKYAQQLKNASPNAALSLIANKADLTEMREVSGADLEALAQELGAPLLISSAKTGVGVEQAFQSLAEQIILAS
jgi:small GTP-binding protein